jgi:hypothetical protein
MVGRNIDRVRQGNVAHRFSFSSIAKVRHENCGGTLISRPNRRILA